MQTVNVYRDTLDLQLVHVISWKELRHQDQLKDHEILVNLHHVA